MTRERILEIMNYMLHIDTYGPTSYKIGGMDKAADVIFAELEQEKLETLKMLLAINERIDRIQANLNVINEKIR